MKSLTKFINYIESSMDNPIFICMAPILIVTFAILIISISNGAVLSPVINAYKLTTGFGVSHGVQRYCSQACALVIMGFSISFAATILVLILKSLKPRRWNCRNLISVVICTCLTMTLCFLFYPLWKLCGANLSPLGESVIGYSWVLLFFILALPAFLYILPVKKMESNLRLLMLNKNYKAFFSLLASTTKWILGLMLPWIYVALIVIHTRTMTQ